MHEHGTHKFVWRFSNRKTQRVTVNSFLLPSTPDEWTTRDRQVE
jgi:hypothetical protein